MLRSTDRLLTSHVGALPRPANLPGRDAKDYSIPEAELAATVLEVVRKQAEHGVSIVGDGEFGKSNFLYYVRHQFSGFEERSLHPGEAHPNDAGGLRDLRRFPAYFAARGGLYPLDNPVLYCAGKVAYRGHASIETDIRNLKSAMQAVGAQEGFLTAISPCTVAITMPNGFYASHDEYNAALADALHDEYRAITDAGLVLQIDEPGLPGLWQTMPGASIAEYRQDFARWVEILNFALRDCPAAQVRLHCCWGSYRGPHTGDIGLEHFVDLLFGINATCYSIEGANSRHEHEWAVFRDNKLPDGKMLMPGVVSHASDIVEHPQLIAQRLVRYADVVGRENVVAGTDCGLRRVHDEICWAKMAAMAAGAEIASRALWP